MGRRGPKPGYKHSRRTVELIREHNRHPKGEPMPPVEDEAFRVEKFLDEIYGHYASMHPQYVQYACGGMHIVEKVRRWVNGYSPHNYPDRRKDVSWENLLAVIEIAGARAWDDNNFHEGMSDCLDYMEERAKENL